MILPRLRQLARRILGRRGGTTVRDDRNSQYDRETIQVIRRILKPNSCGVDVGAHRGEILSEMLAAAPQGIHLAFEPLPHLAEHLRQTYPKARVHELALSDHSGASTFVQVENDPAYSGLRERIYDRPDPHLKTIHVQVEKLDSIVGAEQQIAFIKLDIEGGELHALCGAADLIKRCQPILVFEAGVKGAGQYGVSSDDMFSLLENQFGYTLSTMARRLAGTTSLSRAEFSENWQDGPDYMFMAYPRALAHP